MRTVAQLTTELTPYLAKATGNSAGTSMTGMLNIVLPRLCSEGDWSKLLYPWETTDASSGYFCIPPEAECVVRVTLEDIPLAIRDQTYDYQQNGPGKFTRPVGFDFGIVDRGFTSLMSELPTGGADEFIFTTTGTFADGDYVQIIYSDTTDGYTEVTLPLEPLSPSRTITAAADDGGGLVRLAVNSTSELVEGMGITVVVSTGDSGYAGTWRINSVDTGNSYVYLEKAYAGNFTGTFTNARRLMPSDTIASVSSLVYTSLPARTLMKDADGIIYAILPPGDGVSAYRRYDVPQVPEDTTDEWTASCILKRKFIPITATTDIVYLDNVTALRYAFQAVCYEDEGDFERSHIFWGKAKKALEDQLHDQRGGVVKIPEFNVWGDGVPPMPCWF